MALPLLRALCLAAIAVVPGTAFGENGTGHVRACFATSYEQLIVAFDRMDRFVQGLKK
jgi:aminotransferase